MREPRYDLYNQKNMELLAAMDSDSLDAIVTDCPYGFGKEPDAVETLQAWITTGYHEITGGGFMGKEWDSFVPQPLFWKEAFRVLKPGGHVLAFFGTRTYDWGVMAIRLAGFEIRDCIQWIYGSGFPKSLDVSKAIDKAAGVERIVIGSKNLHGYKTKEQGQTYSNLRADFEKVNELTTPTTEAAKLWEGYGTNLKPANEPICVARKPLDGTVVNNVLKHGCGAINIDGCRIEPTEGDDPRLGGKGTWSSDKMAKNVYSGGYAGEEVGSSPLGRFPANIIFDEEAAAVLDEQSGMLRTGAIKPVDTPKQNEVYGKFNKANVNAFGGNEGGASRFFYVAKASKEDRNYGCEGLEEKQSAALDVRPTKRTNPENWTNIETPHARPTANKNNHPTVKPISLMRYLVRLVKMPFDTCKIGDFFMGSGTTGIACMLEGIDFVGCDQDAESYEIAKARISSAKTEFTKLKQQPVQGNLFETGSGDAVKQAMLF